MKKGNSLSCDRFNTYYYDYLTFPDEVPQEVLEHFQACENCRERVQELKAELTADASAPTGNERLLALQMGLLDKWISCGTCRPFLPLLLVRGLATRVETPVFGHIESCRACSEDLRRLQLLNLKESQLLEASAYLAGEPAAAESLESGPRSVLEALVGRADAVRTQSHFNPSDETSGSLQTQVVSVRPTPGKQPAAAYAAGPWVRRITAAAAVFLVAGLLYLNVPEARGFSVKDVFHAIQKIHTVRIKNYYPENAPAAEQIAFASRPAIREICVSDPLGLILYKTDEQSILMDQFAQRQFMQEDGVLTQESMSEVGLIHKPWGLLPFDSPVQIPAGYQWEESTAESLKVSEGIRVYDLTWTQGPVKKLWRGFLNAEGLPVRVEFWDQLPNRSAEMVMLMEITYPSLEQMKEILKEAGFQSLDVQIRGE